MVQGNCKFGPKCANVHVLPDGRRVNYSKNGVTIGPPPVPLGVRVSPLAYHQPSNSALTNSFLRADAIPTYHPPPPPPPAATYGLQDDRFGSQLGPQPGADNNVPTIDTTFTSNPPSVYGSPRDEDTGRLSMGLSPAVKGLSVMDAPLPASFDSNGISHAARYGPWPASVPSKFGLESPSPSLSAAREGRTSETLKMLHTSAFGSSDHLPPSAIGTGDINGFGGSSPALGSATLGSGLGSDDFFGKRSLHSSSLRYAKPRLMSSSVPKIDRDWEPEFMFEEDYVPGSLANEVLTPAEKARRGSSSMRIFDTPDPVSTGESLPISMTKFGSPLGQSPSRWTSLFQKQKEEEMELGGSRSLKHIAAFGHVGSPLRNSSLATAFTAEEDDARDAGTDSVSALTRQLRETHLAPAGSGISSPLPNPIGPRTIKSNGATTPNVGIIGEKEHGLERHITSPTVTPNVTTKFSSQIDEEDSVFRMEEEDEAQLRAKKSSTSTNPAAAGATSPLSSGWSYASVVANSSSGALTQSASAATPEATSETK